MGKMTFFNFRYVRVRRKWYNSPMDDQIETDCLEIKESAESHAEWLHEWILRHPNFGNATALTGRVVIISAVIIGLSIIVAAFICRPAGVRYRSIGTNRIFDVQTGEVKWAEPKGMR